MSYVTLQSTAGKKIKRQIVLNLIQELVLQAATRGHSYCLLLTLWILVLS